jgi:predicted 2-oxoglutarate/Fe(II)-dependent dioxygenase YbiX
MLPNLQMPHVVFNIGSKIFIKHDILSVTMCEDIIRFGEQNVKPGVNKYPSSDRVEVDFQTCLLPLNHPIHSTLADVWKSAIEFFKFDITFIEQYELKKYENGGYFGKHTDTKYINSENWDRKLTMVIQLSDEQSYKQGGLSVLGFSSTKKRGSVIVFPSFFPHEVKKTEGIRWSLIGWAWGPYWK